MVTDQMKHGIFGGKRSRLKDRVAVAFGRRLHDEMKAIDILAGRLLISRLIARTDNNGNRFDPGRIDFFDDHFERRFIDAVAIDQPLERQRVLARPSRRDESFLDFHELQLR